MSTLDNTSTTGLQVVLPASPINEKQEGNSPSTTPPELRYAAPGEHTAIGRRTRIRFYIRLLLFFLIEAGFIILAAVCLSKPIPLHILLRFNDSEVKGGFTVVFIVWHSLAAIAGGHLLADAFSREWSVQLANIVPGTTDRVSTVTSGFLDRSLYLFTKRASGTFKLAFLASLSFMALTQLAPGTISAATTLVDLPITVSVGTMFAQIASADATQQFLSAQNRANLIVRLELIERSPFGLKLPPNALMAIPPNLGEFNGTLEYDTDIVEFHHDCRWEAPQLVNITEINQLAVVAGGQGWHTTLVVGPQGIPGSSISPLSLLSDQLLQNVSTNAYLFIGGNSTFRNNATPFAINLGNLPASVFQQGVGVTASSDIRLIGPLASVLLCDPHFQISGGRVSVFNNGTVSVISSGRAPSGSFSRTAANIIFTSAFQVALVELEPLEIANLVNNIASAMFMQNATIDWNTAQNIAPLDIPSINKNVDLFMSSAAKAFIDGYRKAGAATTPTFDLAKIPGIGQEARLALTTSKGLFIATAVVDLIAFLLLYALCRSAISQKRYPFDLHNVIRVFSEDDPRRRSLLSPVGQGGMAA